MGGSPKNTTRYCAVGSCPSPVGVSYHNFPKDPKLQKVWLTACRRKDLVSVKNAFVCAQHFRPDDFERDLRNELLKLPLRGLLKPGEFFLQVFFLSRHKGANACSIGPIHLNKSFFSIIQKFIRKRLLKMCIYADSE